MRFRVLSTTALLLASAMAAEAQAWNYPSFQTPRLVQREFNFALSDGGHPAGTSFVAQWREGVARRSQLSLDFGIAESEFWLSDTHILLGGQYGYALASANADMPFDMMLTAGVNAAMGDPYTLVRIPVGVSLGHRFDLDGALSLTPYIHPRLSYDRCADCGVFGESASDLGFDFDFGVDFRFKPQLAARFSVSAGGSDFFDERWEGYYYDWRRGNDTALGISLAWSPGTASSKPTPPPQRSRPPR